MLGGACLAMGLLYAAIGGYWQAELTGWLLAPAWSANLVLWLPFWPFEPFLSLFALGLGTLMLTHQPIRAAETSRA